MMRRLLCAALLALAPIAASAQSLPAAIESGLVAGPGSHAAAPAGCEGLLPGGIAPAYGPSAPGQHTELCYGAAFALSHDNIAHEPRWVGWLVTAAHTKAPHIARTDDFRADPNLPPGAGARPADYDRSGYDQGHMSDAEDNGWSAPTEHLSFLLSNMIPQCPACNRQTWRYIENWTREETAKHPVLYVLSGPIFGADPPKVGHDGVWVPAASWKLVLDLDRGEAWAFIVPNDAAHLVKGADITPYIVAPAAIEAATGLKLPIPSAIPRDRSAPMD